MGPSLSTLLYLKDLLEKNTDRNALKIKQKFIRGLKVIQWNVVIKQLQRVTFHTMEHIVRSTLGMWLLYREVVFWSPLFAVICTVCSWL